MLRRLGSSVESRRRERMGQPVCRSTFVRVYNPNEDFHPHQTAPGGTGVHNAWCVCWPAFQSSAPPPPGPPRRDRTLNTSVGLPQCRSRPLTPHCCSGRRPLNEHGRPLTEGSQELVAAREPPELHADRHLNGRQGKVLVFIARLKLHQDLMKLVGGWRKGGRN